MASTGPIRLRAAIGTGDASSRLPTRLTREHAIVIAPGEVIHPDLGLPEDGFFVEVDHLSWHGGRHETAYDRRRDMKLRLVGAQVERVSDIAIEHHLDETVEDLWMRWQQVRRARG